ASGILIDEVVSNHRDLTKSLRQASHIKLLPEESESAYRKLQGAAKEHGSPINLKLRRLLNTTRPIYRRDLHAAFGGQNRSGISTGRQEPVVLLFSDPVSGPRHGYIDGWQEDGFYHYTGEGQSGDQLMEKGNKAVRDHEAS